MIENEYDYEGYSQALEKVLDGVTRDYWASYIDINRHQVTVGRTYLWVSAALIGVYTAGYEYFKLESTGYISLTILGVLSYLLAFGAFGICLYAIPARKGYKTIPLKGWGEFSHSAYDLLLEKDHKVYPAFLSNLISKIDNAYEFNFKTNQKRAYLLRITSWLLISSFIVALITITSAYMVKPTLIKKDQIEMSNEKSNDTTKAQKPPSVPKPPPPANVGGKVHTHSEEPPTNRRTFTDSVDKK